MISQTICKAGCKIPDRFLTGTVSANCSSTLQFGTILRTRTALIKLMLASPSSTTRIAIPSPHENPRRVAFRDRPALSSLIPDVTSINAAVISGSPFEIHVAGEIGYMHSERDVKRKTKEDTDKWRELLELKRTTCSQNSTSVRPDATQPALFAESFRRGQPRPKPVPSQRTENHRGPAAHRGCEC